MDFGDWLKKQIRESSDMKELLGKLYDAKQVRIKFYVKNVSLINISMKTSAVLEDVPIMGIELMWNNLLIMRWFVSGICYYSLYDVVELAFEIHGEVW